MLCGNAVRSVPERNNITLRANSGINAGGVLRFWHLSSLDAPSVALTWSLAFAWAAHVRLPWWVPVLLPLTVWAVYVVDRLLDARRGLNAAKIEHLRERHIFHWRFRRVLAPLALASALAAAWIIFALMPRTLREHDSLLAAASLLYFTRVHSRRRIFPLLSKEFLVGVLFTLGCVLPAWSRTGFFRSPHAWPLLTTTIVFVLLAWLNCEAIDQWESNEGESKDAPAGGVSTATFGLCLAGVAVVCAALWAPSNPRCAILLGCGAAAALLLSSLDLNRDRFAPVTLRAAADLALLTPALLIAFVPFVR
jgi:hypothetical protein